MTPFISIIIPTYHDWQRLAFCVNALTVQAYPKEKYEVIIVNNDPEDESTLPFIPDNFKIITEKRQGSYAARNAGLRVAKGDLIAFTDSDCIPASTWIKSAVDFFKNNPNVKRLGGDVKLFYQSDKLSFSEIYEKVFSFPQEDYVQNIGAAATANMFAYKELFLQIGFFEDKIFSGGDMDWGIRANNAGYRIAYCPDSVVRHPARSTLLDIIKKSKRAGGGFNNIGRNRAEFISLIVDFLPPILSVFKVLKRGDLSLKEKIISINLKYLVKLIISVERIKVTYFGKKPENL